MGLFSFGERDLSDVWEGLSHPKAMPGYVPAGWIDWLAGLLAQETLIMSESATHQYSSYNSACSSPYIYDSTDHSYIPRERKPRYSTSCRAASAAGSVQLSGVRLSVRLSVPSGRRTPLLRVCCCGPGGQEISIDCCTAAGRRSSAAARPDAGSATLSADVGSWTQTC